MMLSFQAAFLIWGLSALALAAAVSAPAPASSTCSCIYQDCGTHGCCDGLVCRDVDGYKQCYDESPNEGYIYNGHTCAPLFSYAGSGTSKQPHVSCCNAYASVNYGNSCSLECQGVPQAPPEPASAPETCACVTQDCSTQGCCDGLVCMNIDGLKQCYDTSQNEDYLYDGHTCAPLFAYAGSGTKYQPYTNCCNPHAYLDELDMCSLTCQGLRHAKGRATHKHQNGHLRRAHMTAI